MSWKEHFRQFRAAPWASAQEQETFLAGIEPLSPAELLKLLAVVTDAKASKEHSHRRRVAVFRRLVEQAPDPALFIPFVRCLRAAEPTARAALADLLPKVNHAAGHEELAGLLRLVDVPLRRLVLHALRQIGGRSVFEATQPLATRDVAGRSEAIEVIAHVGWHHAIPTLASVVVGAKPEQRVLALRLLADRQLMGRHPSVALDAMAPAVDDPSDVVAVQAVASFVVFCDEKRFHETIAPLFDEEREALCRAAIEAARRFPSPRTMRLLETRFRLGPSALRLAVLATLEAIGNDDTLPLLAEALDHKQGVVREKAAEVISALTLQNKVNLARALMWLLRSRDENVRAVAVDLAKKVSDPNEELWPTILRFLRDEDWWVRERVMDALVEMAGTQLTRHIVGYLRDPSTVVRRYAVDVLIRLKDPTALGHLVQVAKADEDWWVRERAVEAIGRLGDARAVGFLVELMAREPDMQLVCLPALAALNAKQAVAAVTALVGDTDVDVRLAAVQALETLGSPALAPRIGRALTDPDHRVRTAAQALFQRWGVVAPPTDAAMAQSELSPLERLLVEMERLEGDDLLLAAGREPYLKRMGRVSALPGHPKATQASMQELIFPHLSPVQRQQFDAGKDIDFSFEVKAEGLRFRANVFRQQTGLAAVFRLIKNTLLDMNDLGLPDVVRTFGDLKNGLVLVGGPTGSGKSTTLASIIDHINRTSRRHIVTLEDPIEVMHERRAGLVNQREIGTHTLSFQRALRSVLRQDPDVLLVGEMRDLDTIAFAVTAAETGHLVFGTVHTVSADTTVDRLVNAFPSRQQSQVRSMLAESLRAVLCQHLLRRADGPGRALSVEVMLNTDAVANLIRQGKTFQLPSLITTGRDVGMQSMDGDLKRLVRAGIVAPEEAYMKANNKKDFTEFADEWAKSQGAEATAVSAAAPRRVG